MVERAHSCVNRLERNSGDSKRKCVYKGKLERISNETLCGGTSLLHHASLYLYLNSTPLCLLPLFLLFSFSDPSLLISMHDLRKVRQKQEEQLKNLRRKHQTDLEAVLRQQQLQVCECMSEQDEEI